MVKFSRAGLGGRREGGERGDAAWEQSAVVLMFVYYAGRWAQGCLSHDSFKFLNDCVLRNKHIKIQMATTKEARMGGARMHMHIT